MIPSLHDYVNREVLHIWEQSGYVGSKDYIPQLFKKIDKNPLLFIGLNPSLSKNHLAKVSKRFGLANPESMYYWKNRCRENYERAIDLIEGAEKLSSFATRFQKISKVLFPDESRWTYIDLFFWRQTKQKDFKKKLGYWKGKPLQLADFWKNQLELSFGLIKKIDPRIIVVQNALAASLFIQERALRQKLGMILSSDSYDGPGWDPFFAKKGYFQLNMNSRNIPVFFSQMLYAQGALDDYSLDRLIWHMKRALSSAP
jgi:hypothetical protein